MLNILFVIIELFRYLLQLRRYKRKSVKVAVFRAQISDGRGLRPPTTVGVRKLEWLPFRVVSHNLQYIVWFCDKARVWQRDRQDSYILAINLGLHGRTDGQMDTFTTPNSQDRASLSRAVKVILKTILCEHSVATTVAVQNARYMFLLWPKTPPATLNMRSQAALATREAVQFYKYRYWW